MLYPGDVSDLMPDGGRKRRSNRHQQAVPDRVADAAGGAYPSRRYRSQYTHQVYGPTYDLAQDNVSPCATQDAETAFDPYGAYDPCPADSDQSDDMAYALYGMYPDGGADAGADGPDAQVSWFTSVDTSSAAPAKSRGQAEKPKRKTAAPVEPKPRKTKPEPPVVNAQPAWNLKKILAEKRRDAPPAPAPVPKQASLPETGKAQRPKAAPHHAISLTMNGWYPPAPAVEAKMKAEPAPNAAPAQKKPAAKPATPSSQGNQQANAAVRPKPSASPAFTPNNQAKPAPSGLPAYAVAGGAPMSSQGNGQAHRPASGMQAKPPAGQPNPIPADKPKRVSGNGGGNGNKGATPVASAHRPGMVLLVILLGVSLLVGGFFWARSAIQQKQLEDYVLPYNSTFVPGVYVDGIPLANMTADEARQAVHAQINNRNDAWKVRLTYHGSEVIAIDARMLNMQVDVETVLRDAWAQGHTGSLVERRAAMEQLLRTPYQGYTATPSRDTSVIDRALEEIQNAVYMQPQDARMIQFDPNSKTPFTFEQEVVGRRLNVAPLKERLYQMVSTMESGDVEIEPDLIQPNVTLAQLKPKYTLLTSVYTPISKNSTENRTNNIRRSFQPLNGYILAPTRKLSYNQVVGMRTLENGFYEAPEHVYGQLVEGVGGGTCQASTTLYQAAVTAGMDIISRRAHTLEVSYSQKGQDATVYWTRDKEIDLVIRNNTNADLYFTATVESDPANKSRLVARVSIYGEPLEAGVSYQLESKLLKNILPPEEPKYIKDTKATYVTYTDEQKSVKAAREGYEIETFRVKYINGQEVEKKSLGVDTYPARPEEVFVGVTKR